MSAATFQPLADRIEDGIRARAQARTEDALAQARDIAFKAYANAFRPVCGVPFEVFIGDVMRKAEESIREAALVEVQRNETAAVLRRLGEETA